MGEEEAAVGAPVTGWRAPPRPARAAITGRWCALEPLSRRHGEDLASAYAADADGRLWTYLAVGPFADREAFDDWLAGCAASSDPQFFAVIVEGRALGVLSYLRIAPGDGTLEIGWIAFSPALQRTTAATEAVFLLMRGAFDAGYRRVEWKCDALNAPSRRAATRFGFQFEGIFRQATVVKGRNRDTAWYAVIDRDWPPLAAAFEAWLSPETFDAAGRQRWSLATRTGAAPTAKA